MTVLRDELNSCFTKWPQWQNVSLFRGHTWHVLLLFYQRNWLSSSRAKHFCIILYTTHKVHTTIRDLIIACSCLTPTLWESCVSRLYWQRRSRRSDNNCCTSFAMNSAFSTRLLQFKIYTSVAAGDLNVCKFYELLSPRTYFK